MNLFSDPSCPYCHRVRMVIAEKGIAADITNVDASALPEEVMVFNPYATVPTLVDRDLQLYESRIIMEYLDERFPHPPLMPIAPIARANARIFMFRIDREWYSRMHTIKKGNATEASQARKELRESLIQIAPVFAANKFFFSDEFSLLDCYVAPLLLRLPDLGVELPKSATEIRMYMKRIFAWPAFRISLSDVEQEMLPGAYQ